MPLHWGGGQRDNVAHHRKWRSGSASPCQGEGRGFESRLPLSKSRLLAGRMRIARLLRLTRRTARSTVITTRRPLSVTQRRPSLTDGVVEQQVSGQRIGPPPLRHSIENEAAEHRRRQDAVDHGDSPLGPQHRVVQCSTRPCLSESKCEHHCSGHAGPGDANWAVPRMETDDESGSALDGQINGKTDECEPDQTYRSALPFLANFRQFPQDDRGCANLNQAVQCESRKGYGSCPRGGKRQYENTDDIPNKCRRLQLAASTQQPSSTSPVPNLCHLEQPLRLRHCSSPGFPCSPADRTNDEPSKSTRSSGEDFDAAG